MGRQRSAPESECCLLVQGSSSSDSWLALNGGERGGGALATRRYQWRVGQKLHCHPRGLLYSVMDCIFLGRPLEIIRRLRRANPASGSGRARQAAIRNSRPLTWDLKSGGESMTALEGS